VVARPVDREEAAQKVERKTLGNWFLFFVERVAFLRLRRVLVMTEEEEFQELEQRKKHLELTQNATVSVEAWITSRSAYGISTMSIRDAYLAGYKQGWVQHDT
jgi:hypothetical protein